MINDNNELITCFLICKYKFTLLDNNRFVSIMFKSSKNKKDNQYEFCRKIISTIKKEMIRILHFSRVNTKDYFRVWCVC